jgi:acyl-CoA dehydrogenase
MKWLVYHTSWLADQNADIRLDAAMAKLHCVYAAHRVVDNAMQIHGAMGLSEDTPLAYYYNGVRRVRVAEGTMEIMRLIISRKLLGRDITG